jgi:hypothetical protein
MKKLRSDLFPVAQKHQYSRVIPNLISNNQVQLVVVFFLNMLASFPI